jgi:phospholipid transport system substrate-binding protein
MSPTSSPRRWIASFAVLVTLSCPASAQDLAVAQAAPNDRPAVEVSAHGSPQAVVLTLQAALLKVMQEADALGFEGRYELLKPVVAETFDVRFMGSKSVGRYWNKLDADQQAVWLTKFAGYLTANYAGNFNEYDGESFEVLGEESSARKTQVVLTRLNVPSGEDVVLNYRLREASPGEWRIIDIYLKGTVSELALRRSDFSATLKEKGFGELTLAIDKKIAELRKKGGG